MRYLPLLLLVGLLGCKENYRYPCQDPRNWEDPLCTKPRCSANGTCPEDLKHYEKDINSEVVPNRSQSIGDCR